MPNSQFMHLASWILRLGTALTFTGHGLVALGVKKTWLPYLMVTGMSEETAMIVMPYIGFMDLLVALLVLVRPFTFVLFWAVFWAFVTALARPLAGEGWVAFLERGANWATPLALCILQCWKGGYDRKLAQNNTNGQ